MRNSLVIEFDSRSDDAMMLDHHITLAVIRASASIAVAGVVKYRMAIYAIKRREGHRQ